MDGGLQPKQQFKFQISVVRFPHHLQNSFKPYNLYTIAQYYYDNNYHNVSFSANQRYNRQFELCHNKKIKRIRIINPIVGLNCTTLCYTQLDVVKKMMQRNQQNLQCKVCGKIIHKFCLDLGFKQFLFKYYRQSQHHFDQSITFNDKIKHFQFIQLNAKTMRYRKPSHKYNFQGISEFLVKQIFQGNQPYLSSNILFLNFRHLSDIKQVIRKVLRFANQYNKQHEKIIYRNSLVYSWCRLYKKDLTQPQLLVFTAKSIYHKRVKLNFQITQEVLTKLKFKANKKSDIDPKLQIWRFFYQGSKVAYIFSQQIFIICLPCFNSTLYYSACLKSQSDYKQAQGILNFKILKGTSESLSRKFPSTVVDQHLRTIYFFGGFNDETDYFNPSVTQISNIRWSNPRETKSYYLQQPNSIQIKNKIVLFDLKDNVQIFKSKNSKAMSPLFLLTKANIIQTIQGLRSMNSLLYHQYDRIQKKMRGAIQNRSQIKWLSFGGIVRQFGHYQPRVLQKTSGIREIIYRQNNRDTGAIIQQGRGRDIPLFNCKYPLVYQIPMIGVKKIDQSFLNCLLIIDFHQNIMTVEESHKNNKLQTDSQIFKLLNTYEMRIKKLENVPQFSQYQRKLLKNIVSYDFVDHCSSIIYSKNSGVFLRITIPTIEWTGRIRNGKEDDHQNLKEQIHRAGYIAIQFYLQHPNQQVLKYQRVQIDQ